MYQHYIQLKTPESIDDNQMNRWYRTTKEFGPENIVQSYEMNGNEISMDYSTCSDCEFEHIYTIPLNRDLTQAETQFIMQAWEHIFSDDFDIEISNLYDAAAFGEFENSINIDDDIKSSVLGDMSKWNHNRWVDELVKDGWRWGLYFNSVQKTHPALRDWDNLSESHRRVKTPDDNQILEWLHSNKGDN